MSKLLAALVATAFALGSASGFAADAAKKKEELTKEERAELRNRAERLAAERGARPAPREQAATRAAAATRADLTPDERTEMRHRAERLAAQRAHAPTPEKAAVQKAPKAKKHPAGKPRKDTLREGKPAQPKI